MRHIKSLLLISGPYDLVKLIPHFDRRGLHLPMLEAIMGGRDVLPTVSPTMLVKTKEFQAPDLVRRVPPIFLFHGTADLSVPCHIAEEFYDALKTAGYRVQMKLYEGKSHTDPIIEDLLYADEVGRYPRRRHELLLRLADPLSAMDLYHPFSRSWSRTT